MGTTKRPMNPGYIEHDHVTEWQECDSCGLRTGVGITTEYDHVYYPGDPDRCPRCSNGRMGLPDEKPGPAGRAPGWLREAIDVEADRRKDPQ